MDERVAFEIGVAVPKRNAKPQEDGKEKQKESWDCSEVLVREFEKVGLVVEPVIGVADEFIKVLAFIYLPFLYCFFQVSTSVSMGLV